jgi:hypothetical protein
VTTSHESKDYWFLFPEKAPSHWKQKDSNRVQKPKKYSTRSKRERRQEALLAALAKIEDTSESSSSSKEERGPPKALIIRNKTQQPSEFQPMGAY